MMFPLNWMTRMRATESQDNRLVNWNSNEKKCLRPCVVNLWPSLYNETVGV